jgi:hypothetical protein
MDCIENNAFNHSSFPWERVYWTSRCLAHDRGIHRLYRKWRHKKLFLLGIFVSAGTCLPSRRLAPKGGNTPPPPTHTHTHTHYLSHSLPLSLLWERFIKAAVEMGSGVMIYSYIPSFIKTDSGVQKLLEGNTQPHRQEGWRSHNPTLGRQANKNYNKK